MSAAAAAALEDHQKEKTCSAGGATMAANANSSSNASNLSPPPPPPANRNKFTLEEVGEQLRSIRKLDNDEPAGHFLNSNAIIELNNNTIQPTGEQQKSSSTAASAFDQLRMDLKRATHLGNPGDTTKGLEGSTAGKPAAYTSLFAPTYRPPATSSSSSSNQRSLHQIQQRNQLKRQKAAGGDDDLELPVAVLNRLPVQQVPIKKPAAGDEDEAEEAAYDEEEEEEEEEETDEDDDDLDERLPFNSVSLSRSVAQGRHKTAEKESADTRKPAAGSPAPAAPGKAKQLSSVISFDNKCERNQSKRNSNNNNNNNKRGLKSPHQSKISLGDSRPPSFSSCHQPGYIHLSNNKDVLAGRKLDWQHSNQHHQLHQHHQQQQQQQQQQQILSRCDCSNCYKKFSSLVMEPSNYGGGSPSTKYPKTYSMHMVLKSIILILVTLLLSMLFLGVIMASHYMPHAVERLLNTPRTFNVTIATG